jgi:AraC-like DNA-binding protein
MKVKAFNIEQGLYIFEFNAIETEVHCHPAVELIFAAHGTFTLWTSYAVYNNLKFAIVAANQKHKIHATNCQLKIIMVEHHNNLLNNCFITLGIDLNDGYHAQEKYFSNTNEIKRTVQLIKTQNGLATYDTRVSKIITYLNKHDLEYGLMMGTLKKMLNLSESRVSHLFKLNVGISLKKYLIWTKLKLAIKHYINSEEDLFSALINGGFYDQPHFSKSFKNMLGIKPSKVYNSRILQVLPPQSL